MKRLACITAVAAALAIAPLLAAAGSGIEEIDKYHRVSERVSVGGQPTPEQVAELGSAGFRAVVNLRQSSEADPAAEQEAAAAAGLRYVAIPIVSASPSDEGVAEFLAVTDDPDLYPVFIHCATANRASALWMVRRVLREGWALEEAEAEATRNGLTSEGLRKWARAYVEAHPRAPAN
jgi:uncharacterized protein (TIGR01244 family)